MQYTCTSCNGILNPFEEFEVMEGVSLFYYGEMITHGSEDELQEKNENNKGGG